jgi:YVTN family beta-propeller protein
VSPSRLLAIAAPALACSLGSARAGFDDLDRLVFVANRTTPAIAVVDSASDRVVGRVEVGAIPHQFVLSDEAGKLIASHLSPDTLGIVDLRSDQLQRIDLDVSPEQMEIGAEGAVVAIASARDDALLLLSLDDGNAIRRINDLAGPGDLVFDRDGALLFVASTIGAEVAVVDVAAARVVTRIELGSAAGGDPGAVQALARTPGGELGFALHGANGRVSVIDLRARRHLTTIALPGPALRAYPTADSQHVLVPNERDGTVSLISTWSFKESARLPGAASVSGINTGMFDTLAVVISRDADKALLLDLLERRPIGEIALPSRPETGVSAVAGTKLYIALAGSDRLAVIDLRERRLLTTIDGVGVQPWGVSMASGLSYCH